MIIEFTNIQHLPCKIEYDEYESKYFNTHYYVHVNQEWKFIKSEKIKKTKFESVINCHKQFYVYYFDDIHIEVETPDYWDYCTMSYADMDNILNNIDNIPYHKHDVCNGVCFSMNREYEKTFLNICRNAFPNKLVVKTIG